MLFPSSFMLLVVLFTFFFVFGKVGLDMVKYIFLAGHMRRRIYLPVFHPWKRAGFAFMDRMTLVSLSLSLSRSFFLLVAAATDCR